MSLRTIYRGCFLLLFFLGAFQIQAQIVVEDHWSPYDYPKTIREGTKYHIIVKGDTLWDIAGHYLGDPFLWPHIYEVNPYILDPDWIYPGDPVSLEIGTVVNEKTIGESVDGSLDGSDSLDDAFTQAAQDGLDEQAIDGENGVDGDTVEDRTSSLSVLDGGGDFVILPAGDRADMECSTYLYSNERAKDELPFDFLVMSGENRIKINFGFHEVVYLNKGEEDGIQPGELYSVRRPVHKVYAPYSESQFRRAYLGTAIDQVGQIKIVAVQKNSSTAIVSQSCHEVRAGDFLVPYEQEPVPLITELPVVNRFGDFDKTGAGSFIYSEDNIAAFGKEHLAIIDLGIEKNVAPGDLFIVYRSNPGNNPKAKVVLPDIFLGNAVALRVSRASSVVKVISSDREMKVGDRVVALTPSSYTD